MTASRTLRPLFLGLVGSCALIGGYGAFGIGARNGLFDGFHKSVFRSHDPYVPGHKFPVQTSFTGIAFLDQHVSRLLSLFICAIDGDKTWDVSVSYWYLMVNFLAGWCLLVLEGMRRGNVGKAVSWTGTMGLIFQNISYTVTVPIYLVLHLLTSPTARPNPSASDLQPRNPLEPSLIPVTSILSFAVPAILMALPAPHMISPGAHYLWLIIWQLFPLWQTVIQWALTNFVARNSITSGYKSNVAMDTSSVYRFVLFITIVIHLPLLEVSLLPGEYVPAEWPAIRKVFEQTTFWNVFIPAAWSNAPSLDSSLTTVSASTLAPLVKYLLQWDAYGGSAAVLLWSVYLRKMVADGISWFAIARKLAFWTALGGLVAPAAVLLWERDEIIAERSEVEEKKTR